MKVLFAFALVASVAFAPPPDVQSSVVNHRLYVSHGHTAGSDRHDFRQAGGDYSGYQRRPTVSLWRTICHEF